MPTSAYTAPWGLDSASVGVTPQAERVLPFSVAPYRLGLANKKLALVARTPAEASLVDDFIATMTARYPPFNFSSWAGGAGLGASAATAYVNDVSMPGFASCIRRFDTPADLDAYVKDIDYATTLGGGETVWAAIVFNSGAPTWDYSIRMNLSETVSTAGAPTDNLERGSDTTFVRKYVYSTPETARGPPWASRGAAIDEVLKLPFPGFMSLQLMVDRWIINRSVPLPTVDVSSPAAIQVGLAQTLRTVNAMTSVLAYILPGAVARALAVELALQTNVTRRGLLANDFIGWAAPESYAPQQVDLVPFPVTAYSYNDFFDIAAQVLAFFLTVCFLFPVSRLIRGLVAEKETKIREGMKMMVRCCSCGRRVGTDRHHGGDVGLAVLALQLVSRRLSLHRKPPCATTPTHPSPACRACPTRRCWARGWPPMASCSSLLPSSSSLWAPAPCSARLRRAWCLSRSCSTASRASATPTSSAFSSAAPRPPPRCALPGRATVHACLG